MLWQVLDEDVNAMTEKLLKVWCSPKCATSNESSTISHLQEDFHKLSINNEKGKLLNVLIPFMTSVHNISVFDVML